MGLPECRGPWQTVHAWHRRLTTDGTWETILQHLLSQAASATRYDKLVVVYRAGVLAIAGGDPAEEINRHVLEKPR